MSALRHRKFSYLFHCFDLDRDGILGKRDHEQFAVNLIAALEVEPGSARAATVHGQTIGTG